MGRLKEMSYAVVVCLVLMGSIDLWGGTASGVEGSVGTVQQDVDHWLAELEQRVAPANAAGESAKTVQGAVASPKISPKAENPGGQGVATARKDGPEEIERISIDFLKVDLHNIFTLLGQVSGKNIVVDEDVKGTLTLSLQDVPWTFVLDVIKNLKNLSSIERYNTIMIYPTDKKVAWGGESEASGTLDLKLEVSDREQVPSGLLIESAGGSRTSVDAILEAERFASEAADAEKEGDLSAAMDLFKKAADIWPDNILLTKKVALLALAEEGDELTALNYARKALRVESGDSESSALVAVALARMEKSEEAQVYFERAMDADVIPFQTLHNYAVFSFSQGKYRDALRLVNRIEDTYPLPADMMMLRAQTFERLNSLGQAITEYRAIVNAGKSVPADIYQYAETRLRVLTQTQDPMS
jgi:type IV pilus assembly protein PilQ